MMPKESKKTRKYTTVSIPVGLADRIDQIVKRGREYQNRGDFVLEAIRRRLEEFVIHEPEPMLKHFNLNEQGVMVLDKTLEPPNGRIIQVYFKEGKAWCEYDETDRCRHIDFALELSEVQEILRKKGWKAK